MIPTVKHERNDNDELTTDRINMSTPQGNGISKEQSTSLFSRVKTALCNSSDHANEDQVEEENELVELNDCTRVSLINQSRSPSVESNPTAQDRNGVHTKEKTVMSMNDHAVNGIEVVQVETIC